MPLLAVDLAARYSAYCLLADDGTVLAQGSSAGMTETDFIDTLARYFEPAVPDADLPIAMIVEDLPHGVAYRTVVKSVCRLQGRLYERMHAYGRHSRLWFVQPQVWRKHHQMKNGTGPEAVIPVAAALGYQPPDGIQGGKPLVRKIRTDYCAAFLIGRWALHYLSNLGPDVENTALSGYTTPLSRKARKEQNKNG